MTTYTRLPLYRKGSSSIQAHIWRGAASRGSADPANIGMLLTEDGVPIISESNLAMLVESA